MKITEIKKYFEQKVDKDFTGYLNTDRYNRLFKDTLYRVVNERIANFITQKNYDEISFLLKTDQSYSPNANVLTLGKTPITSVVVTNASTYTITSGFPHNMVTGDSATIADVAGTTTANGTFTVIVTSPTVFTITAVTGGTYTSNTGSFYFANQVYDYYRLLAAKTTFQNARTLNVTGAKNATPIRVSFDGSNNIRTGEQVLISGVLGNTAANGTFYVQKINSGSVDLYTDEFFGSPVAGSGAYTSGGTVATVRVEYAMPISSDRKISDLTRASIDYPRYEETQHALNLYPDNYVCSSVSIDYFKLPKLFEFTDLDTDYSLYYNDKFIFHLIDSAAKNFTAQLRDTEGYQIMSQEAAQNK